MLLALADLHGDTPNISVPSFDCRKVTKVLRHVRIDEQKKADLALFRRFRYSNYRTRICIQMTENISFQSL